MQKVTSFQLQCTTGTVDLIKQYHLLKHTFHILTNFVYQTHPTVCDIYRHHWKILLLFFFSENHESAQQCHFHHISNDVLCFCTAFCDANDSDGNYIYNIFGIK